MNLKFWTWELWSYRRRLAVAKQLAAHTTAERQDLWSKITALEQQRDKEREQVDFWRAESARAVAEVARIDHARTKLETRNAELETVLKLSGVLAHVPIPKPDLYQVLSAVTANTDWWKAMHSLVNDQERLYDAVLCVATTEAGELAEYNRGRKAAMIELRDALLGHASEAQREQAA
jgi:hypothetical protein